MASALGIPVAPLREVKETFKQSTYEAPLGPGAGENAAEAAKSALAATKKFVDFAAPHVRSATTTAFGYSKQHATTAAGKLKQAHAKGDIRAPTLDEATDFAKSTSRRALGACVHAFDAITESGSSLVPVSGPFKQGLSNLGNSCYVNSIVQMQLGGTVEFSSAS